MRSIKVKIGALVLLSVLFIAGTIGVNSIQSAQRVVRNNAVQLMMHKCAGNAEVVNALSPALSSRW